MDEDERFMLSRQEENKVTLMGKRYFNTVIQNKSFSFQNRRFGVEVEFSLVDDDNNLVPGSSIHICRSIEDDYIIPEYGSYQIEINPPSSPISKNSFKNLYQTIKEKQKKIGKKCDEKHIHLLPIGIPFTLDPRLMLQKNIVTPIPRYVISTEYFHMVNKPGAKIDFSNGSNMNLPGNSGLSIINELHVHVQALDIDDVIKLFNFSQMINAPFVSLSANSGILNGKELIYRDYQISIFEQAEGLFDGPENIPRVGLFPDYISSISDYFDKILNFKPLYFPEDHSDANAFELIIGKYFGWTRIRIGFHPSYHMRIEFRPMSTQPTILENIALTEFYIKTLLHFVEHDIDLIPKEVLKKNFYSSMMQGMHARLFWDLGAGLREYPVNEILQEMFDLVDGGVYYNLLENRIKQYMSPAEKMVKNVHDFGFRKSVEAYEKCYHNDYPYI